MALDVQSSFADLGEPLADVEFVVVDLETTGGSPADCAITEIGAVRVRGGERLGEFQTLVNPGTEIPPFIAALTGITSAAVATAPPIAQVLPSLLEFAHGGVLVAHNAGFDVGFLKAACAVTDTPWPGYPVVDTARLARVLLHRDEVANHRLATLARHFRAGTTPNHRALADARATVDVLHGLLERAAAFGVHHLDDLTAVSGRVRPEQRRKRTLADGLPTGAGVYQFWGPNDQLLYVGKSKAIRTRVRTYFTASETRSRIIEMVRIATRVTAIPCASDLEAHVREVRLIGDLKPPYNRRSKNPEKALWLKLTVESFPRLIVTGTTGIDVDSGAVYLGPYRSRQQAEAARDAALTAFPLRTCTQHVPRSRRVPACIAAELGTCPAPCCDAGARERYDEIARATHRALTQDPSPVVEAMNARMSGFAEREAFESAARERDRLGSLLLGQARSQELNLIRTCPQVVAARPDGRDWVVHVLRWGRLAGTGRVRPGDDPRAGVRTIVAAAEHVHPPDAGRTAASHEETSLLLTWLWSAGTRLVSLDGHLTMPIGSAARFRSRLPTAPARVRP